MSLRYLAPDKLIVPFPDGGLPEALLTVLVSAMEEPGLSWHLVYDVDDAGPGAGPQGGQVRGEVVALHTLRPPGGSPGARVASTVGL